MVVALVMVAGTISAIYDTILVAFIFAAVGLVWSSRDRKAWALAAGFVLAGLFWSSLDTDHCSAWWRGKVLWEKTRGRLEFVEWDAIRRSVLGPCYETRTPSPDVLGRILMVKEEVVNGQERQLFQTSLGHFWIPAPGFSAVALIDWEITVEHGYDTEDTKIVSGDTVIDCGAHVGIFTRYSLDRGAAQVIAVEPDANNISCFEANLAPEIAAGRVKLIKGAVWDRSGTLALQLDPNSAKHSAVAKPRAAMGVEEVRAYRLDEIVEQLGLDRVDFIKMDIEGAERQALKGAERTLKNYRPKLAICVYHSQDEPAAVGATVAAIEPGYQRRTKDLEFRPDYIAPKVIFFR